MRSLGRRLLIGAGAGTAIVLVGAGTALDALMRASLLREFDAALGEKAVTLSAMVEQDGDDISLEFTEAEMGEFRRPERPEYFQVWREDGTVVEKSPSLRNHDLPREVCGSEEPVRRAFDLPNGKHGRLVTVRFTPRLDDESPASVQRVSLTLALARDIVDVESSLGQLRLLLIVVGASAILASVGALAWLVRLGLKPLDRLAQRIGLIDERGLSATIDRTESPRELSVIVGRLNEMLGRLDAAFHREKKMTANVAHELRTPLAGIRSTLEVALSRERDSATSRQVMSECLQICTQTQRLIDNLLAMARLEAGKDSIKSERTEVETLLRKAWKSYDELAREQEVKVQWEIERDLQIETDAEKLQVVFANVLENAAQYVDTGGTITIHAGRSNGRLQIRVSNTGSKLANDEVSRVFDPFWRGDASRTETGTHCGLGLPLCKAVVERLGGAIHAESTQDGRFVVSVTV